MDSTLGGVRSRCEELRSTVELQEHYERLVHSLKELIHLGSERLAQQPDKELQSRTQLQEQLSSQTVSVGENQKQIMSLGTKILKKCLKIIFNIMQPFSSLRSSSSSLAIIFTSCSI